MTLILALSCCEGKSGKPMLLIAADRQVSSRYTKTETTKIRFLPEKYMDVLPSIVFAAAGDAYIVDEIHDAFDNYLSQHSDELNDVFNFLNYNRIKLSDIVGNIYVKYKNRGYKSDVTILLCGCNNQYNQIILQICNEGLNMIHYDYCIIGMGSLTGGELLLNELFYSKQDDYDAVVLACLIINLVSKIDLSVGKGIDLVSCINNKVRELTKDEFHETKKSSDNNWSLIKKIWRYQNYHPLIDELKKMRELIKTIEQKEANN